jgi:hypothetical protein
MNTTDSHIREAGADVWHGCDSTSAAQPSGRWQIKDTTTQTSPADLRACGNKYADRKRWQYKDADPGIPARKGAPVRQGRACVQYVF